MRKADAKDETGSQEERDILPSGDQSVAVTPVPTAPSAGLLEGQMTLAHSELCAAARIRAEMDGHLNMAMQKKLDGAVSVAAAKYVTALDAFEASA